MPNTSHLSIGALLIISIALLDKFIFIEARYGPENMVWIKSGTYQMGSDTGMPDESPQHAISLSGFWIDKFEVTNGDYRQFIAQSDYVTFSERVQDSLVFKSPPQNSDSRVGPLDWWDLIKHADWRHPQGPEDNIDGKSDHPVVHVAYADALAYCNWLGKDLPTEAQFEFAARGGRDGEIYSWGNVALHRSKAVSNNWQGTFPHENTVADGYATTAPVGSFPANDFGLYDITGNVWEWVSDWYHPRYYSMSPTNNPVGVTEDQSIDPAEPGTPKRSIRGGSFLCSDDYCSGFRVSARMPAEPKSSTNHTGFRCVNTLSVMERLGTSSIEW